MCVKNLITSKLKHFSIYIKHVMYYSSSDHNQNFLPHRLVLRQPSAFAAYVALIRWAAAWFNFLNPFFKFLVLSGAMVWFVWLKLELKSNCPLRFCHASNKYGEGVTLYDERYEGHEAAPPWPHLRLLVQNINRTMDASNFIHYKIFS